MLTHAASHPVSVKELVNDRESARPSQKNQSSLGLSMHLHDTFRNYLRLRIPCQISHPPRLERNVPSRELRQMFARHDQAHSRLKEEK